MTHPVQKEQRQTGLLIPSFGNSSTKGMIAGDSVYWVFNRSMDATVGAEYYSKRGWFQRGEFRARPSDNSYRVLQLSGNGGPRHRQSAAESRRRGRALSWPSVRFGTFRGVANVDYLSSFVFRIAFTDVYTQAIDSEVRSQIFLSNTTNGFHFNALAERYQNFEVCNPGTEPNACCTHITQTELVRILHTPSFFISGEERQLGNTPLYWSFESAAEGLQRREVRGFAARVSHRRSGGPVRSGALAFDAVAMAGMVVPSRSYVAGYVLHRAVQPGIRCDHGRAADDILNRKSLEASFELRPPALSRVFDRPWLGRKWKHVIEPRMRYDYVTGRQ